MIKNFIFDIGDVLVSYSSTLYAANHGISADKLEKANQILIKENMWRKYLNGLAKVNKLLDYLIKSYPNYTEEFKILLERKYQSELFFLIEENVKLLKQLKEQGHAIYLLSNITKETLEVINENYDFVKWVDGGVFSYQEHISKPNKEIYTTLLSRYSLIPKETIFIDDRKKNVEVANELGMIGIQYEKGKRFKQEIQDELEKNKK